MAVLKTQFTLRLDLEVHSKLKKIAEEDHRSMTNMIEHILLQEIKRYEKENGVIEVTDEDLFLN